LTLTDVEENHVDLRSESLIDDMSLPEVEEINDSRSASREQSLTPKFGPTSDINSEIDLAKEIEQMLRNSSSVRLKDTIQSISRTSLVDGETKIINVPAPRQNSHLALSSLASIDSQALGLPGCGSPTFFRNRSRKPSLSSKRPRFHNRKKSVDNNPNPRLPSVPNSKENPSNRSSSVLGMLPDIEPSLSQDWGPDIEDREVFKISNIILQRFDKQADKNLPLLIINFAFLCVSCESFLGGHYCPAHYTYECGDCWEKSCCSRRGDCSLCSQECNKCNNLCCSECVLREDTTAIECKLCRLKSRLAPD